MRVTLKSFVYIGVVVATWMFTGLARGTTYYVDRAIGNDSNTGLSQTAGSNGPLRSIQAAFNKNLVGGDIIEIKPTGEYTENLLLAKGGTTTNPIIIRGFGYPNATRPVINFTGTTLSARFEIIMSPYPTTAVGITIQGLEFKNAKDESIKVNFGDHITIQGCYIHDSVNNGIFGQFYQSILDSNLVVNNGSNGQAHGFYVTGQQTRYTNNILLHNAGYGIQTAGYNNIDHTYPVGYGGAYFKQNLVANNTAAWNGSAGMVLWGATQSDPHPGSNDDNDVENNLFYQNNPNPGSGVPTGIYIQNPGTQTVGNRIKNNLSYGTSPNATFFLLATSGSVYTLSGNLPATAGANGPNPLLINGPVSYTGAYDLHLQTGSPAINAGLSLASFFTTDFAGTQRPQGAAWDIGAYEAVIGTTFTPIASSTFTGADENPLSEGGVWTTTNGGAGSMQRVSNAVTPTSLANDGTAKYTGASFNANQYSRADLTTVGTAGSGAGMGLCVRCATASRSSYRFVIDHAASNNAQLGRFVNNTFTALVTWTQAFTNGDEFTLAIEGETLYVYDKTLTVVKTYDDTGGGVPQSGQPGISFSSTESAGTLADNWSGGNFSH